MIKYYEVHSETPFVGEDGYEYIKTNDLKELYRFAEDCCMDNAMQWSDEDQILEYYPDLGDYYADCTYSIKEITKEEYYEMCPWDNEVEGE